MQEANELSFPWRDMWVVRKKTLNKKEVLNLHRKPQGCLSVLCSSLGQCLLPPPCTSSWPGHLQQPLQCSLGPSMHDHHARWVCQNSHFSMKAAGYHPPTHTPQSRKGERLPKQVSFLVFFMESSSCRMWLSTHCLPLSNVTSLGLICLHGWRVSGAACKSSVVLEGKRFQIPSPWLRLKSGQTARETVITSRTFICYLESFRKVWNQL